MKLSHPTSRCPQCGRLVRVTTRQALFHHSARPVPVGDGRYTVGPCAGGGGRVEAATAYGSFYVLSLKWSRPRDPYLSFWGPKNCGYKWALTAAGQYTADEIRAHLPYYNDGESALAVPCAIVDSLATPMDPAHSDFGTAPAVRFSRRVLSFLRRSAPIQCAPRFALQPTES